MHKLLNSKLYVCLISQCSTRFNTERIGERKKLLGWVKVNFILKFGI